MSGGIEKTLSSRKADAFSVIEIFGEEARLLLEFQRAKELIKSIFVEEIQLGIRILRFLYRRCLPEIHAAHLLNIAMGYARLGSFDRAMFFIAPCLEESHSHYEEARILKEFIVAQQVKGFIIEPHQVDLYLPSNQKATKVALIVGGKLVEWKVEDKPLELLDPLSAQIYKTYCSYKQTPETYERKMLYRDQLEALLKRDISEVCLDVNGTSLDLKFNNDCLQVSLEVSLPDSMPFEKLHNSGKNLFVSRPELYVKLRSIGQVFRSRSSLGENFYAGDNPTFGGDHLFKRYTRLDDRVAPLIANVTLWARKMDINDPNNCTLSEHALTLMLIHYLQCGFSPPILPNLVKMRPPFSAANSKITKSECNRVSYKSVSSNNQSLGELLLGFFRFYSQEFNFHSDAINMKEARREFRFLHQIKSSLSTSSKYIHIRDSTGSKNVAQSVSKLEAYQKIKDAFRYSYWSLARSGDLNSLGYVI